MKTLIVATSGKPIHWQEEIQTGRRYRLEYLELSKVLHAPYLDYDPPWIHNHKIIRYLEEKARIDFYWAKKIAQKVQKEGYEAVITFSERAAFPLGHLLNSQVKQVTILINAFSKKWQPLLKTFKTYEKWHKIILYSQAEAWELQKTFPIPSEKIHVIPNYVDTDFFKLQGKNDHEQVEPFILSQGLAKRDYPTLIRAMRQLPHIDCQISATSAWDNFKTGYESMEIPENVHIKSYDHPFIIRESIAQCTFMVIPIHPQTGQWCTGSTSVLQAQAMGKPIIVTRIPGIYEYIKDGETGFLIEGSNPTALANAINDLWQKPGLAQEMGQCGQAWVRQNFTLGVWINKITDVLRNLN